MATTNQLREIVVTAQPLTPEAFAPYGRIVDEKREPLEMRDGHFTANVAVLRPASETLGGINRHMDHTQVFVPLNGCRTLVVVAPRDVPAKGFDAGKIEAFVADGSVAFSFDAGTWHIEPRALDAANNRVVNVQTDVYSRYTEVVRVEEECGVRVTLRIP